MRRAGGVVVRHPFRRRVESHLVDDFGLVGCSRQGHDVEVDECLRCCELVRALRDEAGVVREIHCLARFDARAAGLDPGLLGLTAPRR